MENTTKNPFEYNVLIVASLAGLARSIFAVIGDLEDISAHPDFITDVLFAVVFAIGVFAVRFIKNRTWVLVFFYIPLMCLFVYSFYAGGGLSSNVEHNIFAGLIFINYTLRDKLPIYLTIIYLIATTTALFILDRQLVSFDNHHSNDLNFIIVALGVIGVTFYAKYIFSSRRDVLRANRDKLEKKSQLLKINQERLIDQRKKLEELTLILDKKVSQKTKALSQQMIRREKYLSLTTDELNSNINQTMKLIDAFKTKHGDEPLISMLAESGNRLKYQIENLNQKVDGNGE